MEDNSKLTTEDKENIRDLVTTDSYTSLIKLIDLLIKGQERSVLKYNLENGGTPEVLAYKRSQLDGVYKLYRDIKEFERTLKSPADRVRGR